MWNWLMDAAKKNGILPISFFKYMLITTNTRRKLALVEMLLFIL